VETEAECDYCNSVEREDNHLILIDDEPVRHVCERCLEEILES